MKYLHNPAWAVLIGFALVAGGCSSGTGNSLGNELYVFNWDDYFAPDTLSNFEQEFGIEVHLDTFDDEDELLSVISSDTSKYDLFIGSDSLIGEMTDLRLLANIDHENVPNLSNIDPKFLDRPGDPENQYSVPYDWGTTGIMYDTRCVQPEEESWAVLADPRVAGKVAMDTDPAVTIGSVLKYLGYSRNSNVESELAEAGDFLEDLVLRQQLRFIPSIGVIEVMGTGELCMAQAYNGDAAFVMADNPDVAFFIPEEGSDLYFDVMAVPRDARHKAAAEAFINYVLRPDVHAAITNYTGYPSPNRAAVEQGYIDEQVLSDPVVYPDTTDLESWSAFDGQRRALWNKTWAEVQRAIQATGG